MIRFVLRLVGALLVEEVCERIRPTGKHTVRFWLDGRWHEHGMGTRYPWQADIMWDASDTALVQAHRQIFSFLDSAAFPLVPLGEPDAWLRYYGPAVTGIKGPTLFSKPLLEGDYMVGVSGTTPTGVDVSTPLIPGGTFKCKQASVSGILPFSPVYEELPADFAPGYRVIRQGTTTHFTPTDPDPHWKDE